ncbi:hypothetical protein [Streptomyces sp. NPDC055287]
MTVHDIARRLPTIPVLRDHCRALAMLEAIICPAPSWRTYSFDTRSSEAEELASMSNGSGDEYSIVFSPAGAYMRGFDHESLMSPYGHDDGLVWPGVLDEVPEVFGRYVKEPAFSDEEGTPFVTVCLWRTVDDDAWRAGAVPYPEDVDDEGDPDGSAYLFEHLTDRSAEEYWQFAVGIHKVETDVAAIRHILALRPLTHEVVTALNPDVTLAALSEDVTTIGYPKP